MKCGDLSPLFLSPKHSESRKLPAVLVTCSVAGYSPTYDGNPHTATGSCTGAGGSGDVLSGLDLSGTTHTASGTYNNDPWTFTDATGNYSNTSGTVNDSIGQASSSTTINCPASATYDGSPQTPCTATATGAGSLSASVTVVHGSNTNVGTATANATYAGDANHSGSTATQVTFTIDKRALTASIIGNPTKTYDGNTTATLTSANFSISNLVAGQSITVTKTSGTYNTKDVSTANNVTTTLAAGDFAPGAGTNLNNYNLPASASGAGHITVKALTITADNQNMIFGVSTPTFTATDGGYVSGEGRGNLSGSLVFTVKSMPLPGTTVSPVTTSTAVGTYAIVPSGFTSSNYNINFVNGTLTIGSWTLTGFYQPVDMTTTSVLVFNTVKGGSTVPLKFNIFAGTPGPATERKSVTDIQSFLFAQVSCIATAAVDATLEMTTTGGTSLRYDGTAGQFIQNWQTPKPAGVCYQVRMTALDGTHLDAFFKTK